MSNRLEMAKKIIDEFSTEERLHLKAYLRALAPHPLEKDWGIGADTILGAIRRSSDLTKRGVRGIIAEAVFATSVIPLLAGTGWIASEVPSDLSYDALVRTASTSARIQIKLQRLQEGRPKLYYPKHYAEGSLFVVEVQKTRSGETKVKTPLQGTDSELETIVSTAEKTRPYRFGDFDILAVNMHPSSGDWKNFRYTLASWLLPRPAEPNLIEIFQPVAATPDNLWTDNLLTCLKWLESGERRCVLGEMVHTKKSRPVKLHRRSSGATE